MSSTATALREGTVWLRAVWAGAMAPTWELAIPLPSDFSLLLLFGFLVWGFWVLFSGRESREQAAAKTDSKVCEAALPWNPLLPARAQGPEAMETPCLPPWKELDGVRGELRSCLQRSFSKSLSIVSLHFNKAWALTVQDRVLDTEEEYAHLELKVMWGRQTDEYTVQDRRWWEVIEVEVLVKMRGKRVFWTRGLYKMPSGEAQAWAVLQRKSRIL